MKILLRYFFPLSVLLYNSLLLKAQDELTNEKEYAINVFRGTMLINSPTTEMVVPHSFNFMIRHRFGEIGFDESSFKQFLGTDMTANIRFSFELPIGKNINVGISRTKFGKTYDGDLKVRFFRQAVDDFPLTILWYSNVAYMSDDFPRVPDNAYFEDGQTPFQFKESHRLSYTNAILVSHQFNEKLSIMLNPTVAYKNLATVHEDNATMLLTFGGSYKTGIRGSFICEASYLFNNKPENNLWPISIGWEWGTVGHVFQLFAASTNQMSPALAFTSQPVSYDEGKFILGFNIKRTFWSKKRSDLKTN